MPVLIEDTPRGRKIYDKGRQEGRQEGRSHILRLVLRQRFGDDPRIDVVLQRLAGLSDDECLARVTSITDLD